MADESAERFGAYGQEVPDNALLNVQVAYTGSAL